VGVDLKSDGQDSLLKLLLVNLEIELGVPRRVSATILVNWRLLFVARVDKRNSVR
jgi:hypothetical protein